MTVVSTIRMGKDTNILDRSKFVLLAESPLVCCVQKIDRFDESHFEMHHSLRTKTIGRLWHPSVSHSWCSVKRFHWTRSCSEPHQRRRMSCYQISWNYRDLKLEYAVYAREECLLGRREEQLTQSD